MSAGEMHRPRLVQTVHAQCAAVTVVRSLRIHPNNRGSYTSLHAHACEVIVSVLRDKSSRPLLRFGRCSRRARARASWPPQPCDVPLPRRARLRQAVAIEQPWRPRLGDGVASRASVWRGGDWVLDVLCLLSAERPAKRTPQDFDVGVVRKPTLGNGAGLRRRPNLCGWAGVPPQSPLCRRGYPLQLRRSVVPHDRAGAAVWPHVLDRPLLEIHFDRKKRASLHHGWRHG